MLASSVESNGPFHIFNTISEEFCFAVFKAIIYALMGSNTIRAKLSYIIFSNFFIPIHYTFPN